jgi:hypothetical protein
MTKQSRFNPDGSLYLNGNLEVVGNSNIHVTGDAVIDGNLTVTGTTTLLSDTVVENSADGYIIDYNDNASSSYYQFGSAGARLTWNGSSLTVGLANSSAIGTNFLGTVDVSTDFSANNIVATNNSNATTFNGTRFKYIYDCRKIYRHIK